MTATGTSVHVRPLPPAAGPRLERGARRPAHARRSTARSSRSTSPGSPPSPSGSPSKGKAGAEELVGRISAVFDGLIGVAERHGGDVLKFRGDALLLFFAATATRERACGAASDMQWTIEPVGSAEQLGRPGRAADVGRRPLGRLPLLPHARRPTGSCSSCGPAATRVFELEDLATAGEIVVSAETAAAVDPAWLGEERDGARLMTRLEPGASPIPPPPDVAGPRPRAVRPGAAARAPCRRERRGRAPPCLRRLREGLGHRRPDRLRRARALLERARRARRRRRRAPARATGSPGSSRTSTSARCKLYLTAGAPVEHRRRRRGDAARAA